MKKSKLPCAFLLSAIALAIHFLGISSLVARGKQTEMTDAPQIAVLLKTLANPFWVAMKEGIEAQAKESGIVVDVFSVQDENDTEGQVRQLETVIGKNYQAVVFAPISPVNLVLPASRAYKKGIFLVNLDERVNLEQLKQNAANIFSFISTDNVAVGRQGAQAIVEQLGSQGGMVAIIEGKAGNASGENRKQGAAEVFEKASNVELVSSQPADWDRSRALDVAANLIQSYPDLRAIYACNDTMALGAMTAVEAAKADILVVGTDGTPEARDMVQAKRLYATVAQDPAAIGRAGVLEALKAIDANAQIPLSAQPAYVSIPSQLIDS